jgi:hypothetical protein
MIYSPTIAVGSMRVTYDEETVSYVMKARCNIPIGVAIKQTCSFMLSDAALTPGPSIIEGSVKQLGLNVLRFILGLFRFQNYDCNPNAQVSASESGLELLSEMRQIYVISDIHAYVCIAVKMIHADADFSVCYEQDGYYKDGCRCKICTGIDPRNLSILRQNV